MATAASFSIDQIVHGYVRGHREVTQSLELDDEARSTMVVMSDLLIDRVLDERSSYLSCYPLPTMSRHVLARTWSAGPEYRPGSVWTHSLLIDYPALAQIHDLAELADLLRRPTSKLSGFGRAIVFVPKTEPSRSHFDVDAARCAIARVYSHPDPHAVRIPAVDDSRNEALALALWRQAWPGLRRTFGFVTGVTDRPVTMDADCTLMFTKDDGDATSTDAGHDALLSDLADPGPTALRKFLSRYVVESVDPRSAAPKVAEIWVESEARDRKGSGRALAKLARAEGLPRLKRDLIVAELTSASHAGLVDVVVEFADEPIIPRSDQLFGRLTDLSVPDARRLVSVGATARNGTLGRRAYEEVVQTLDGQVLASALDDTTRSAVLAQRQDLAGLATFWPSSDHDRAALIGQLSGQGASKAEALIGMFGASIGIRTAEALAELLLQSGPGGLARLVVYSSVPLRRAAITIIGANGTLARRMAEELREGDASHLEIICEAVVRSRHEFTDPHHWVNIAHRVHGEGRKPVTGFTAALLIVAAFRVGGELGLRTAKCAFEAVLDDARSYLLGAERTAFLEAELPTAAGAWSISKRLIAAGIDIWPCNREVAGALALCRRQDNIRDVVDDVYQRRGRGALESALHAPDLPAAAADAIRRKLESPKIRLGFWGF